MNELAVIPQEDIDTALAKVEKLSELFASETTHDNAQAKKDASLGLSKIVKLLDSKRADLVKPALDEQRRINSAFNVVMHPAETLSKRLILQVSDFVKAEEKKEREIAQIQARAEAERLIAGEPVAEHGNGNTHTPGTLVIPKISETKVWAYDIIDESQVPREYLELNAVKVTQSIKAGKRQIPGLKIYEKTMVRRG